MVADRLPARPHPTRRHVLAAAGLAVCGLVGRGNPKRVSAQAATIQAVISAEATLEAVGVTWLGVARTTADAVGVRKRTAELLRTAQCQEEAHANYFVSLGAVASLTSIIPDPRWLASEDALLAGFAAWKSLLVGAHMAAARMLGEAGASDIAEVVFQIGTVESAQAAAAEIALGTPVPVDRAFTNWQFADPAEAIAELTASGFILPEGAEGVPVLYPGPAEIICTGVTGLVPVTTTDQATPFTTPAADR